MQKISEPEIDIHSILLGNEENLCNLKKWAEVLKAPFNNSAFCPRCFSFASVLLAETNYLIPNPEKDLLVLHFPTKIQDLYSDDDIDYSKGGWIILSLDNKAMLSFSITTDKHFTGKYESIFKKPNRTVEGSYHEITDIYMSYLKDLMAVPSKK